MGVQVPSKDSWKTNMLCEVLTVMSKTRWGVVHLGLHFTCFYWDKLSLEETLSAEG